jgi:hypothetical protein
VTANPRSSPSGVWLISHPNKSPAGLGLDLHLHLDLHSQQLPASNLVHPFIYSLTPNQLPRHTSAVHTGPG